MIWDQKIFDIIYQNINIQDIQTRFYKNYLIESGKIDKEDTSLNYPHSSFKIDTHILLSFNYTKTPTLYEIDRSLKHSPKDVGKKIFNINIHGEIDSKDNPIVFGYGDELCQEYKNLELKSDNRFFEHIKSFAYLQNSNYKNLLESLDQKPFQVIILGHACGLADRTLLNTIFEHENCISIKPYYFLNEVEGYDNYNQIAMNISRSFSNKKSFRDIVVNKQFCTPFSIKSTQNTH